jgi:predicted AlkP superfamily pyrophosphatase or phosphodiesterase
MKNIFIILDGLGYDQLMKFKPKNLMERGKRAGLTSLETLLAYSSGIYPSIWTGLYPDQTNFWTEFIFQEKKRFSIFSPLSFFPGKYFSRRVAFVLSSIWEKLGLNVRDYFGIQPAIQGYFVRQTVDYRKLPPVDLPYPELISNVYSRNEKNLIYLHYERLDTKNRSDILQYIEGADTAIVCIAETDHAGHLLGPLSEAYRAFLDSLDERLAQLIDQVEAKWPNIQIYIFSDHGMTVVKQSFDLWTYLEQHGFRLGHDYIAFINSTITSLWFNHGYQKEIVDLLNRCEFGRVLTHEERIRYHLDFHDRKYGDEIFVVDEGVELIPNFISLAWKPNFGMHGFDPICSSTKAFLIGSERNPSQLKNVVDIYGILKRMGNE